MTDEETQRIMEFILQQQAKFSTDMHEMREAQSRFGADMQQIREQIGRLAEAVMAITGIISRLGDAHERTEKKVAELASSQTDLAQAQIKTDERLNVLINIFEQHISKRRNGNE